MIVGIFFLLFGISILLRIFFGWHIPIFRTFFALFLIYLGIKMLVGRSLDFSSSWRIKTAKSVVFDQGDFHFEKNTENHYSTVFGSSTVDLTHIPNDASAEEIHIDTVFGETKVLIDPKTPIQIRASAVFGEAKMPEGDSVVFGTLHFKTPGANPQEAPRVKVRANVVFGSIRFVPVSAAASSNTQKANTDESDDD